MGTSKKKKRIPDDWTISITVDGSGNITYGGYEKLKVFRKDRLEWKSATHDFAVVFGKSPYTTGETYRGASLGNSTGLLTIRKPAKKKEQYKYTAAVYHNGSILLDDPIIIIDDDGGGGTPK